MFFDNNIYNSAEKENGMKKIISFCYGASLVYLCLFFNIDVFATDIIEACIPGSTIVQPNRIAGKWKARDTKVFPSASEIINSAGAGGFVYGLYTWSGEYKLFRDSIRKVGWRQVRFAGPFTDETMRMVAEDGIEVMPTLGIYVGGKRKTRADYDTDEDFINGTLKGLEAFLVRYGPGGTFFKDNPKLPNHPIKFIEIWNEPNFQYMIPPDGRPRIEIETAREKLYAKLLEKVYPALKSQWPEVQIIGFAAGGESSGDIRFFEHVLAQSKEVTRSFDIISTHPYVGSAPPEEDSVRSWGSYSLPGNLAMIRDILKKNGCKNNMPIRYTELGWPISQSDGGRFPDRHKERIIPKQLQAAYVVRSYAMALRLGVERVNIMFIADSDGFNGGFFDRRDMGWRPSAHAVKAMIDIMPDPELIEVISDGDDGYYAYKFRADRENDTTGTVTMIWNSRKARTVKHPATDPVTLVDMLGYKSVVNPVDGDISFHSGACPVYIIDNK
jgi:hypothetical protein